MAGRIGGTLFINRNGTRLSVRGSWDINPGRPKRDGVAGADLATHGFVEKGQVPFIEGEISLTPDTDMEALWDMQDGVVTADLANGWTAVLRGAWHAGDGTLETEDGKSKVRFEGLSMDLSRSAAA